MRFATTLAAALACACHAAAQTPPPPQAPELAAEVRALTQAYDELLNIRGSGAPPSRQAKRLLADPRQALAVLEKQFYAQPAIESLAWYGSLAEDLAYLHVNPPNELNEVANAQAPRSWLPNTRSTWRRMTAFMEAGWPPGQPWRRFGAYGYTVVTPSAEPYSHGYTEHVLARWFTPAKPSFWRQDSELFVTGGDPLTKRLRVRGASAEGVGYVAEISASPARDEAVAPRSHAGAFRKAWHLLEFLKGQDQPPTLRFVHARSHGTEGLLGTVGVDLRAPTGTTMLWALGREGVTPITRMQLTAAHVHCGANQGMQFGVASPLKSAPLAFMASLRPLADPSRAQVKALGTITVKPTKPGESGDVRYTGWRLDLDGDGVADLLVAQGRGPNDMTNSGTYTTRSDDSLGSIVWANIGGTWKLVAYAAEGLCT